MGEERIVRSRFILGRRNSSRSYPLPEFDGRLFTGMSFLRVLPRSKCGWWVLWWVWVGVIVCVTTVPWSDFQGHAHWAHIYWIPFSDLKLSLRFFFDLFANVVLFLPFGWTFIHAQLQPEKNSMWRVFLLAVVFSASAELFQSFCHGRIASATDLCTNSSGAVFGATIALRSRK